MAENPDRPPDRTGPTRTGEHPAPGGPPAARTEPGGGERGGEHRASRTRRPFSAAAARRRVGGAAATAVSVLTTAVVAVLAVHIVFVAFEANTGNGIVQWFGSRARELSWQFKDVFQPDDPKLEVAVNYGLAALVYLVLGRILVGLLRRL
ncbi:hypothetical protein ACN3XK_10215 [Actinomadura welshii]